MACLAYWIAPQYFRSFLFLASALKERGKSQDECRAIMEGLQTNPLVDKMIDAEVALLFGPAAVPVFRSIRQWAIPEAGKCACNTVYAAPEPVQEWDHIDGGTATDVAVLGGQAWVIGIDPQPGGFGIHYTSGTGWGHVDGGAVAIAVQGGNALRPWVVNDAGGIFFREGNSWKPAPGSARDIGASSNGVVCVVGTNPVAGGFGIYSWDGADWKPLGNGGGIRITVDSTGAPWVVNDVNAIWRWDGQWRLMPGSAVDIGAGPGGVYVIGTDVVGGGHGIFKWNGANWDNVPGWAGRVAVGSTAWVVNQQGQIFRKK